MRVKVRASQTFTITKGTANKKIYTIYIHIHKAKYHKLNIRRHYKNSDPVGTFLHDF